MRYVFGESFCQIFERFVRKNPSYKKKISKQLDLFRKNHLHPSLRFHKLSGQNIYSVSIDKSIRMLLKLEDQIAYFIEIGTHDEVY